MNTHGAKSSSCGCWFVAGILQIKCSTHGVDKPKAKAVWGG